MTISRAGSQVVAVAAVAVIGLVVRVSTAAQGWFYWDDFTLLAQAREFYFPSAGLLFQPHDGHFMPGSWLVIWLFGALTEGYNWPAAVVGLALGQAAAVAAVGYAALRINPAHAWWVTALYVGAPLTLPVTTWLAAAVNSLPLHAACALWLAHGWLYLRHGRRRDAAVVAVAVLVAGAFSERALLLAPVSLVLVICWPRPAGQSGKLVGLTGAIAVPTAVWALAYVLVVGDPRSSISEPTNGAATTSDLFVSGYLEAFFPTLVGGPWSWERWHPGPPFAAPSTVAIVLGVVAAVMVFGWAARRRGLAAMAVVLLYPLLPFAALAVARTGVGTAAEITQTLRHFAEVAVLLVLTIAALAHREPVWPKRAVVGAVTASALVSTVSYGISWADQPARTYFTTLQSEVEQRGAPILDQAVPLEVLLPVVNPYNLLSRLLPEGQVVQATQQPTLVDASGHLISAELAPQRATETEPGCIAAGETQEFQLDGPLLDRDWVVRLNLNAVAAGDVTVAIDDTPVTVSVDSGLAQWHVQLEGGGSALTVTAEDSQVCLGRSEVGLLVT